ncbi:hypothetical protein KY361_01940 [Candidatus Woesearchaeota archaeon]|nr:hypothetical protein [Candidatus Woesearchaeota archaeon]
MKKKEPAKKKPWWYLLPLAILIILYVVLVVIGTRYRPSSALLSPSNTAPLKAGLLVFAAIYFLFLIFIFSSRFDTFFKRTKRKKR